jgi:hypothetical protein
MAIARKFDNEVRFWNVPDLIARAADLPVDEMPVDRFNLDVDAWFGEACKPTITNVVHHMKYVLDADLSEPILLSAEGYVFDGLHRLAKCMLEGIPKIRYRQFSKNPDPFKTCSFAAFAREKPLIAESLVWMEENGL